MVRDKVCGTKWEREKDWTCRILWQWQIIWEYLSTWNSLRKFKVRHHIHFKKDLHRLCIKMDLSCLWELICQGERTTCNWLSTMALGTFQWKRELNQRMEWRWSAVVNVGNEDLKDHGSNEMEYPSSPSSWTRTSFFLANEHWSFSSSVFTNKTPLGPSFPPNNLQTFSFRLEIIQFALFLGHWAHIRLKDEFLWLPNLQTTDSFLSIHSLLGLLYHFFLLLSFPPSFPLSFSCSCLPSFLSYFPLPLYSFLFLPPPCPLLSVPHSIPLFLLLFPFFFMPSFYSSLPPLPVLISLSILPTSLLTPFFILSMFLPPTTPLLPSCFSLSPFLSPPHSFHFYYYASSPGSIIMDNLS